MPQPRAAMQLALGASHHYLGCSCCMIPVVVNNDDGEPNKRLKTSGKSRFKLNRKALEDTSIVYRLHLECGQMINLYDLFTAFESIVEQEDPKPEKTVVQ
jgi:origin recognition complex subunit 3